MGVVVVTVCVVPMSPVFAVLMNVSMQILTTHENVAVYNVKITVLMSSALERSLRAVFEAVVVVAVCVVAGLADLIGSSQRGLNLGLPGCRVLHATSIMATEDAFLVFVRQGELVAVMFIVVTLLLVSAMYGDLMAVGKHFTDMVGWALPVVVGVQSTAKRVVGVHARVEAGKVSRGVVVVSWRRDTRQDKKEGSQGVRE